MIKEIALFNKTEDRLLASICEIKDEGDFIVYRDRSHPQYRLGNGICIKEEKGKTLKDWEVIFRKYFDQDCSHQTFTFVLNDSFVNLIAEAKRANYKEINMFPIEVCDDSPYQNYLLPEIPRVNKLESVPDWGRYKEYMKNVHPQNSWLFNEGFEILKYQSQVMDIKRFFTMDEKTKEITSILGVFVSNNVGRIENMETHPKYRQKGLASHLMVYAMQYCIRMFGVNKYVLLCSDNEGAIQLYKKFGFNIIGHKVELVNYS